MRLVGPGFIVVHIVALHAAALWFRHAGDGAPLSADVEEVAPATPASGEPATGASDADEAPRPQLPTVPALRPGPLELDRVREEGEKLVADLGNGWTAELTTDTKLQRAAERVLKQGRVPLGAVVVVDVKSGDVLAMAERFDRDHEAVPPMDPAGPAHLALRAVAPAASVFKIVTAAALLDAGVAPDASFCFKESPHRISAADLEGEGTRCSTIGDGLAHSTNGLFARLASEKLDRARLDQVARRFGFNQVVPFAVLNEASRAQLPRDDLEYARAAAGFWHTWLTPLHGALIAAAVAGDGQMPSPQFVARLRSPTGDVLEAPRQGPFTTAMTPEIAAHLRKMMRETVEDGTARRAFAKAGDALEGLAVGGKTGSLTANKPVTAWTWFVGFAPAEDPQIAFAVMVGNGPLWWMRATDVARDVLAAWNKQRRAVEAPAVAHR